MKNQEPTVVRSQDYPHLEVGPSVCQSRQLIDSDPDWAPHMLTAVQSEIRYRPHPVTGFRDEIPYGYPGNSSGKEEKARTLSQPQFLSEKTPATIETDQFLLALQQSATNSDSANFNNNNNRISKLPEYLTTTMPTSDGKSGQFELFEGLYQPNLKDGHS